jgi:mevalonate kinase
MSGEASVSAPGKTILFGEHAAVYGHAALVTALDHRMTVTVRATASSSPSTLHLAIPSLGIAKTVVLPHDTATVTEPGDLALLAVTIATEDLRRSPAAFQVRVESSIPRGSGFGSSAALAVGVVAACRRACDDDPGLDEIARLASAIESRQHGRSSGVDVQAVLRGGLLRCRRRDDGALEHEDVPGAASSLDAFRLFHSGTPHETTGDMVAEVRRLHDREPARVREAFATMDAATAAGCRALVHGDVAGLLPIVRSAEGALEAIGVVPPEVRATIRAIEAQGGAAKISGAGGRTGPGAGLVLVVHPDPAWHDRFARPSGWTAHRVSLGAPGLRMETAA